MVSYISNRYNLPQTKAMRGTKILFFVLFLLIVFVPVQAKIYQGKLRYAVTYHNNDVGEIEYLISQEGDHLIVQSVSYPNLLARLFLDSFYARATFLQSGKRWKLKSGYEGRNKAVKKRQNFAINYKQHEITFSNRQPMNFSSHDLLEASIFPLILMQSDLDQLPDTKMREVSTKRVTDYRYKKNKTEVLHIPAGKFDAIVVTRQKINQPTRQVVVWLDQKDGHIPLKIESIKKGKSSTFVLINKD